MRWLRDMANTFMTSFYPEQAKANFASCLLKDRSRDCWEEVVREVGDDVVDAMMWDNFSTSGRDHC